MTPALPPSTSRPVWLILALIFAGLNLRPSMAAIGPLLTPIRHSLPMSFTLLSLLTLLPVLAMGLAMNAGGTLAARFGEHRTVAASLALIGLSSLARLWADSAAALLLTAVTAGAGIAVIQATLPGIVKHHFARSVSLLMGIYVTAIMAGAAFAAALSPTIEQHTGHWQVALAVWSALSALGLAIWFMVRDAVGNEKPKLQKSAPSMRFSTSPRAWLLGVFFGLGTSSYTCALAWLPPYFVELGFSETRSGMMLAFLTTLEVISGMTLPALAQRSPDRRKWLLLGLTSTIAGFSGLLIAPAALPLLWTGLLGFGIGGVFPLTLIVTLDHLPDARKAGQLAAFVQGAGYIIAAFSPLAAGIIRDQTNGFAGAWLMLLGVTLAMLLMAIRFNPAHYHDLFKEKTGSAN